MAEVIIGKRSSIPLNRLVERLRRPHLEVEDCWYSCAKHPECCREEHDESRCTCGADEYNAIVDEVLAILAGR